MDKRKVREMIARLMAAIETPDDLHPVDVLQLLEDADELYRELGGE